jgi:hypothetical protein
MLAATREWHNQTRVPFVKDALRRGNKKEKVLSCRVRLMPVGYHSIAQFSGKTDAVILRGRVVVVQHHHVMTLLWTRR